MIVSAVSPPNTQALESRKKPSRNAGIKGPTRDTNRYQMSTQNVNVAAETATAPQEYAPHPDCRCKNPPCSSSGRNTHHQAWPENELPIHSCRCLQPCHPCRLEEHKSLPQLRDDAENWSRRAGIPS